MPVAFDSTMLSLLLNPQSGVPNDPATGKAVDWPKERVQGLVERLQKEREKIVIPAPVIAEVLTVIGPTNTDYLAIINRSRVFEVAPLDEKSAMELAFLNRDAFRANDKKNRLQPYQKTKVDRQILAICKASGCGTLYTDDKGLIESAKLCGVVTVRLCDLPIPEAARQQSLDLEPHDALPEMHADDDPGSGTDERGDA